MQTYPLLYINTYDSKNGNQEVYYFWFNNPRYFHSFFNVVPPQYYDLLNLISLHRVATNFAHKSKDLSFRNFLSTLQIRPQLFRLLLIPYYPSICVSSPGISTFLDLTFTIQYGGQLSTDSTGLFFTKCHNIQAS